MRNAECGTRNEVRASLRRLLLLKHTPRLAAALFSTLLASAAPPLASLPAHLPPAGIFVVLDPQPAELAISLASQPERLVYCQLPTDAQVAAARQRIDQAGLLGTRVYVERGAPGHLHLADNVADVVIVTAAALQASPVAREELLRVANPLGKIFLGPEELTKPFAAGTDEWSHPYHGPDNNPQSRDQVIQAPYLTQYFATPYYVPPPGVTVAAGGRIFKAHGHLAFHARELPWRNKLVALNAFNGTMLWTRSLEEGFNIHRNTMIATPATLYVGDSVSCKMIGAASGELEGEITAPGDADGPVWKWMALENGVLYGLVGQREFFDPGHREAASPPGWPWKGMSAGYDLAAYPWGFGRTFLAVNPKTSQVLWTHRETEPIDSRGVCMSHGRIFYYSEQKFLACLDAAAGQPLWRCAGEPLLSAIGPTERAQSWTNGMSTFSYVMCSGQAVYFMGPQRPRLVAVSADDGRLLWQYPYGNFRGVLRDEGLYALAGPVGTQDSLLLDPLTGQTRAELAYHRGNCTRATGTADGIFCRAENDWGTGLLRAADHQYRRLPLMRPPCHDGVIMAAGLAHWGTWICDCNVSMIGNISLAPAGDFDFQQSAKPGERLETSAPPPAAVKTSSPSEDWPTFRADNERSAAVTWSIPSQAAPAWTYTPPAPMEPAAPITAYGMVFSSGSDGVVRALSATTGQLQWSAYTGGPILYPPVACQRRLYVGSGDGWVYCFAADSGRLCWRFRAAPVERKIPMYGRLSSTWPVGSGVLVDRGVVYAAAGVASYDGTHVYALDAETGALRWQNNTSGQLGGAGSLAGVSVQGHLLLHAGQLCLAGGNAVSPAVYDIRDGRCLSQIPVPAQDTPEAWKQSHSSPRGQDLFVIQNQVCCFDRRLYGPNQYWPGRGSSGPLVLAQRGDTTIRDLNGRVTRVAGQTPRDNYRLGAPTEKHQVVWQSKLLRGTCALALGTNAVLAAGQLTPPGPTPADPAAPTYAVAALSTGDGTVLWSRPLPAQPAWWGLAVDRPGRIFVTLVDGRMLCLTAPQ